MGIRHCLSGRVSGVLRRGLLLRCRLRAIKSVACLLTWTAAAKGAKGLVPRRRSAMRVPRPGPSSTSRSAGGQPSCCHTVTHQMPTICEPVVRLVLFLYNLQ